MRQDQLINEYFEWLCDFIYDRKHSKCRRLLNHLFDREFDYIITNDGDRAEDGISLRYRFGHERDIDQRMIASFLDDKPCTIFEMMVALAIRCEDGIMCNPDIGDRTSQWFWSMVHSLGLSVMSDRNFDVDEVDYVLDIFLNRDYQPNGQGGLFTVQRPKRDLRSVEIWYQMHWYLDEFPE